MSAGRFASMLAAEFGPMAATFDIAILLARKRGENAMTASAVQQLITDARVPGLSMAVIQDRQALTACGVRNAIDRACVDQQTIFGAASLSKPLFAYAVLQLVDAGKLALDTPLSLHVPDYVADDPRAAAVTVRHVLSHTSGLPNCRSVDLPLKTYFPPGERFSYSGEGFVWAAGLTRLLKIRDIMISIYRV
jgi:CubicO group peptidase (beta-lactamase class C family)